MTTVRRLGSAIASPQPCAQRREAQETGASQARLSQGFALDLLLILRAEASPVDLELVNRLRDEPEALQPWCCCPAFEAAATDGHH
jgi:hypothetical protein